MFALDTCSILLEFLVVILYWLLLFERNIPDWVMLLITVGFSLVFIAFCGLLMLTTTGLCCLYLSNMNVSLGCLWVTLLNSVKRGLHIFLSVYSLWSTWSVLTAKLTTGKSSKLENISSWLMSSSVSIILYKLPPTD